MEGNNLACLSGYLNYLKKRKIKRGFETGTFNSRYLFAKDVPKNLEKKENSIENRVKSKLYGRPIAPKYKESQRCIGCAEIKPRKPVGAHIRGSSHNQIIKDIIKKRSKKQQNGLYKLNAKTFWNDFILYHTKNYTFNNDPKLKMNLPGVIPLCKECHREMNAEDGVHLYDKSIYALIDMIFNAQPEYLFSANRYYNFVSMIEKANKVSDIEDIVLKNIIQTFFRVNKNKTITKSETLGNRKKLLENILKIKKQINRMRINPKLINLVLYGKRPRNNNNNNLNLQPKPKKRTTDVSLINFKWSGVRPRNNNNNICPKPKRLKIN
tara:strand:+ start:168 stop:1139 length:972 start_codon:yes stop_codon:yes gene_type:complete